MSQYKRRMLERLRPVSDTPYDAEVEYLRGYGNQYIAVPDLLPDILTDAVEVYMQQETNQVQTRFAVNNRLDLYINGSSTFSFDRYTGSDNWQVTYSTAVGTVKRTYKVDYLNKQVYVDGYLVYTIPSGMVNPTSFNEYTSFFGYATANRSVKGKMFGAKYWKNGELVLDLIPVRKGQIGYMYDKINRKFYGNAGSGEFGLGRDVYTKLSAYTKIDCVVSHMAEIDTRYTPNGNTRVVVDMWDRQISHASKVWHEVFGARTAGKANEFVFQLTSWDTNNYYNLREGYNTTETYMTCYDAQINRIIIDKNKGNTSITHFYDDRSLYSTTRNTATFSSKYPMWIGFFNQNRTSYEVSSGNNYAFFGFTIYDNDVLIRNYIPVIHPDGTTGLFDSVEKRFYESDSTYSFRPGYINTSSNGYKYIFFNSGVDNNLSSVYNDSDLLSSLIPIKTRRIKIKRDPNYTTKIIEYNCRRIVKKGNETIISSSSDGDIIEVGADCDNIAFLIEGAPFNYNPDVDVTDVGETNYLALTALEDGTFTLTIGSTITTTQLAYVEYSVDGGTTWVKTNNANSTTKTITTPTITAGNKVLWRGSGQRTCNNTSNATQRTVFSSTGTFDVSGNIMSLLYGDNFHIKGANTPTTDNYTFGCLFNGSKVVHSHELCLPIWFPTQYCYWFMFGNCTSLIATPKLNTRLLNNRCYLSLFNGCSSLTELPILPAVYLKGYCYYYMFSGCGVVTIGNIMPTITEITGGYNFSYMFQGCTSLLDASALTFNLFGGTYTYSYTFANCSALIVPPVMGTGARSNYCCQYMFSNCISLVNAPTLGATTLAQYCYFHMFDGCTSIVTAPVLPATTLSACCYDSMFKNCTSLINAPVLPSNSIPDYAYSSMFEGCTSLVTSPTLNAYSINTYGYNRMFAFCTSLVNVQDILPSVNNGTYAYRCMFYGCTSLVKAPKLPRTLLYTGLYQYMFAGCTSLNYIDCMAIDMTATNSILEWTAAIQDKAVDNTQSGVASTGTFIQRAGATWDSGVSGIPQGWTVKYLNPEDGKYYNDSACTSEWQDSPYPSNMTRISYLQNNGNKARIRTGLFNFITKYEVKFNYTTWKSGAPVLDNYNGANNNRIGIIMPSSNNGNLSIYFDTKSNGGATTVAAAAGSDHTIIVDKAASITVDNTTTAITNTTAGTANNNSIALFAANTTNSTLYATGMKIYYFKAWNNGLLIRHLIPVRISDSEGAMYDISNGQLLTNPYEDAFTLGPDIT